MPWLDIAIILVLAIYAVIGLVRGFLKTTVRFGTNILAVCACFLLAPTVALLFTNVIHLDGTVSQLISNSISGFCISESGTQLDNPYLHQFAQMMLGHEYWLDYAGGVESAEFIAKLSYSITDCLFVLISFFLVFGLTRIIISFICHFIRALNRRRVYGWISRTVGAIISLFEGIFAVLLVFVILRMAMPITPAIHEFVDSAFATSPFSSWLFSVANDFLNAGLLPWLMRFYM